MSSKRLSTTDIAKALQLDFSESSLVQIDEEKLGALCQHLRTRPDFTTYGRETWSDPSFWNVDDPPELRSQFLAVGNAINFRYWLLQNREVYQPTGTKKGVHQKGALYMWRCLRVALQDRSRPVLDASFLATISDRDFEFVFTSDNGENLLQVGQDERIANLRDLGAKLQSDWDGAFYNVIKASRGSLIKFSELSRRFRAYDDPYYKLTMVNAILHSGSGLADFDADLLPGIDYQLLKQLLRNGVLLPSPELAKKLETKELLNQFEANELRRVALKAFVIMSTRTGISGEILDNKWWQNRRKCLDQHPVCQEPHRAAECPFFGPCDERIEFTIPLEITRYY